MGSYVPPTAGKIGLPVLPSLERILPEEWLRRLFNWGVHIGIRITPYNVVARELGIEPFGGPMELLMGDLTLVTDVPQILGISKEELESWTPGRSGRFRRKPKLRYVGAIQVQ